MLKMTLNFVCRLWNVVPVIPGLYAEEEASAVVVGSV
jgi:hypothetical protein